MIRPRRIRPKPRRLPVRDLLTVSLLPLAIAAGWRRRALAWRRLKAARGHGMNLRRVVKYQVALDRFDHMVERGEL